MSNRRFKGFTLAEVLITLGVIGVVAAMTMPALISHHNKKVVETRLAKFYSVMNQAYSRAIADYGDVSQWDTTTYGYEKDEDDNDIKTQPKVLTFFNKYFKPYLQYTKIEPYALLNSGGVLVYFPDGSAMSYGVASIIYFPKAKDLNLISNEENTSWVYDQKDIGKKSFTFYFYPSTSCIYHKNKGIEPYKCSWDGTEAMLKNHSDLGCRTDVAYEAAYCTALIQMNGWKIPKDYPFKL